MAVWGKPWFCDASILVQSCSKLCPRESFAKVINRSMSAIRRCNIVWSMCDGVNGANKRVLLLISNIQRFFLTTFTFLYVDIHKEGSLLKLPSGYGWVNVLFHGHFFQGRHQEVVEFLYGGYPYSFVGRVRSTQRGTERNHVQSW